MDALTLVTCAGSALLVVAAAVPPVSQLRTSVIGAWLAVWTFAAVTVIGWSAPRLGFIPDTEPSAIVRYGARELSKANRRPPPNLLVIEGGSYPARGIEPKVLEKDLRKLGYKAQVVHLALGGANHFERYQMLSDLLREVGRRKLERQPNLVFLSEVQLGYDMRVLVQLEENAFSSRAYHYLSPQSGALALWALRRGGGEAESLEYPEWTVLQHVLVNAFNTGLASRLVPAERVKARSGYVKGGIKRGYKFKGLAPAISEATAPLQGQFHLPWLFDIRERRLRGLWGPSADHWVYYALPATWRQYTTHASRFCALSRTPCIASDDPTLLKALDDIKLWRDGGHLTTKGAVVYSKWLAQRLVQTGVLKE